jgi:hypothetical protein
MSHDLEQIPEGTPIKQAEWDRLSEASRRWLVERAAEMRRRERENDWELPPTRGSKEEKRAAKKP